MCTILDKQVVKVKEAESSDPEIFNYICPSLSSCRNEVSCPYKYHHNLPYQWRLLGNEGKRTLSILGDEKGKALEKQFCNPDLTLGLLGTMRVDFVNMTALDSTVNGGPPIIQRLSTPPNNLCSKQLNASNWIWYWQSDDPSVNWSEMKYYNLTEELESDPADPDADDDDDEMMESESEKSEMRVEVLDLERLYDKQQERLKKQETFQTEEERTVRQRLVVIGKEDEYRVILNFHKMTMFWNGDEYEVRRRPDTFHKFVDWCYLEKESGMLSWVTFGDLDPEGETRFPITAQDLESHHQNITYNNYPTSFTKEGYMVDMRNQDMKMVNAKSGKVVTSVRREVFQGSQLIPLLDFYPSNWDPMPKSRIYATFVVSSETKEFKEIEQLFPSNYNLVRLRRIQNPASFKSYITTKENLEKDFPAGQGDGVKTIKEETLFHGTQNVNIKLICEMNFDPSLAGTVNGKVYGAGTYFGKTFLTSLPYCKSRTPVKILLCKVLIGQTAIGSAKDAPNDKRITLVNDIQNPSIIVNRLPHSFLPEYIAELKLRSLILHGK